jgi:hypothetical protein
MDNCRRNGWKVKREKFQNRRPDRSDESFRSFERNGVPRMRFDMDSSNYHRCFPCCRRRCVIERERNRCQFFFLTGSDRESRSTISFWRVARDNCRTSEIIIAPKVKDVSSRKNLSESRYDLCQRSKGNRAPVGLFVFDSVKNALRQMLTFYRRHHRRQINHKPILLRRQRMC